MKNLVRIGIAITGLTLVLIGCGGSSGGGTSSSGASSVGSTSFTATPFKGKFTAGTVTVTDANGVAVVLLNGSGTIATDGTVSISVAANSAYPLTISVTGTYFDENTGASATTTNTLRAMVPDAAAASAGIPITAVTEIATAVVQQQVASGATLSAALVKATVGNVATTLLGQTYDEAMTPPVFDANGKTSDPKTLQLAALAVAANIAGTGADLAAKIKDLGARVAAGNALNAVITQATYDAAVTDVNGGAKSLLPVGGTAPTMPVVTVAAFGLVDGAVAVDTLLWDSNALVWNTAKWR